MFYIYQKLVYKSGVLIGSHKLSLIVPDVAAVLEEEKKANEFYCRQRSLLSCKFLYRKHQNRFEKHDPIQLKLF